nr:MAG: DNA pilot protein [Microvirus sp.]
MPEQVYDPNYDVWYLPSDGDDNSGSGSTPTSFTGLIDTAKNSSDSDRDGSWWNNFLNNTKYVWGKIRDFFNRNNKGIFEKTREEVNSSVMPSHSTSITNLANLKAAENSKYDYVPKPKLDSQQIYDTDDKTVSSEPDYKDVNSWIDLFKGLYETYKQDSLFNSQRAEAFEREEAEKLRQWQEYMSSTSYQRAMADMKAAGINPLLAFQTMTGASTPSGAMASGFNSNLRQQNYGSLFSGLASILGQNKKLGSDFLGMIISLLGLFM